ncbi:MAG: 7TM diverse intracellular signaling domain-containing protein, partial [Pseudomonadales bacterium]
MRHISIYLASLLCCMLGTAISAEPVLNLQNSVQRYEVNSYFRYVEDPDGRMTINDVLKIPQQDFKPYDAARFDGGFETSAFWFRLDLNYQFNREKDHRTLPWILELAYAPLDYVDYYFPLGEQYQRLLSGDRRKLTARLTTNNLHTFPLGVIENKAQTVYLRIQTTGSFQIPSAVYSPANLFAKRTLSRFAYGLYYGVILIMALYNLFLFLSLRDENYIYYVLYISSFGVLQGSISGLTFQYLWPESPAWTNISIPFFMCVSILFATQFSRKFLATYIHSLAIDRMLLSICFVACALATASLWIDYQAALLAAGALTIVVSMVVIYAGFVSVVKGYPGAMYFLLGWTALLLGVSAFALLAAGAMPVNSLTLHAGEIGSSIEVVLLSLALADRVKHLREEKQRVEDRARNALEQTNAELSEVLDMLEESSKLKDKFLAQVSHELRTPLNGIMGSIELMQL